MLQKRLTYRRVLCLLSSCRYNGSLPSGDRGRRKSRFALYRRAKANGVKPSTVHILNSPQDTRVCAWVCACSGVKLVSFLQLPVFSYKYSAGSMTDVSAYVRMCTRAHNIEPAKRTVTRIKHMSATLVLMQIFKCRTNKIVICLIVFTLRPIQECSSTHELSE